jgi:GDSL-like Lipase/Acylhydrolase family
MKRLIPWIVAIIAFVAFCASFSELQRMRKRFGEVTHHQYHDHQDVRQFIIRAAVDGLDSPIVVLGDSIVEMARLPETLCGKPVLNAGIGGSTSADFLYLTPKLLKGVKPALVVVALGANDGDAQAAQKDYGTLLTLLKGIAPRVLAIPTTTSVNEVYRGEANRVGVPFLEISMPKEMMIDGVHFNAMGYRRWIQALVDSVTAQCASETGFSNQATAKFKLGH